MWSGEGLCVEMDTRCSPSSAKTSLAACSCNLLRILARSSAVSFIAPVDLLTVVPVPYSTSKMSSISISSNSSSSGGQDGEAEVDSIFQAFQTITLYI